MTLPAFRSLPRIAAAVLAMSFAVDTALHDGTAHFRPRIHAHAAPIETAPETQTAPAHPVHTPRLHDEGIEALGRVLDEADPAMRDRVLADRLPLLVAYDPWRAARFAELLPDARLRELALLQVAMSWARSDLNAAVHWAESLADEQLRDAAITDISLALAETDPARAVALRERFVAAWPADNTLVNLVHQWAEQDFDAALAWAHAQPAGTLRDQVLQRLVFVQAAAGDFTAATELARSSIEAPRVRAEALAAIAQQEG